MTSLDAHSAEQDLLLNAFHLSQRDRNEASADDPWSAAGPSSVSPFVPCAFGRIPAALRAARLTADDVLWDLGCGDGRVLLQAAAQYGCRCVGLDIDADCIRDATAQAAACGLKKRCVFANLRSSKFSASIPSGEKRRKHLLSRLCNPLRIQRQFP